MRWRSAALVAVLYCCIAWYPVSAQDVTLTSRDGRTEIAGTLLGYDGEFYRVDTLYGELTVDGSGVLCRGPGCPNLQDFVAQVSVSGAASMGRILFPALLESFAMREGYRIAKTRVDRSHLEISLLGTETDRTVAQFTIRATTSDEGFADLLADEADIVMSLREANTDDVTRSREAGMGDLRSRGRSLVLALDAIVPIVSPQNPVREISPSDTARVYAGEINNWTSLGGPDAPITVHALEDANGLGQAIARSVLSPLGLVVSSDVVPHSTARDLTLAVLSDPFAFGMTSYAERGNAQLLMLKGACGRILRATRRSVKTEDYPLSAPVFLYTPARRLPKVAREFLTFARSAEAQVIVRRAGFVDQAFEEVPINAQGDRFTNAIAAAGDDVPLAELQRMVNLLSPMKRLTISFRFEAGSSRLDAQSRSNVVQLARSIEQGRYDARTLYFVGFSDGDGPAEINQRIALDRAEEVRRAVLQLSETVTEGQVDVNVAAFGEALPIACDDSAWGRRANRRVEVWVR